MSDLQIQVNTSLNTSGAKQDFAKLKADLKASPIPVRIKLETQAMKTLSADIAAMTGDISAAISKGVSQAVAKGFTPDVSAIAKALSAIKVPDIKIGIGLKDGTVQSLEALVKQAASHVQTLTSQMNTLGLSGPTQAVVRFPKAETTKAKKLMMQAYGIDERMATAATRYAQQAQITKLDRITQGYQQGKLKTLSILGTDEQGRQIASLHTLNEETGEYILTQQRLVSNYASVEKAQQAMERANVKSARSVMTMKNQATSFNKEVSKLGQGGQRALREELQKQQQAIERYMNDPTERNKLAFDQLMSNDDNNLKWFQEQEKAAEAAKKTQDAQAKSLQSWRNNMLGAGFNKEQMESLDKYYAYAEKKAQEFKTSATKTNQEAFKEAMSIATKRLGEAKQTKWIDDQRQAIQDAWDKSTKQITPGSSREKAVRAARVEAEQALDTYANASTDIDKASALQAYNTAMQNLNTTIRENISLQQQRNKQQAQDEKTSQTMTDRVNALQQKYAQNINGQPRADQEKALTGAFKDAADQQMERVRAAQATYERQAQQLLNHQYGSMSQADKQAQVHASQQAFEQELANADNQIKQLQAKQQEIQKLRDSLTQSQGKTDVLRDKGILNASDEQEIGLRVAEIQRRLSEAQANGGQGFLGDSVKQAIAELDQLIARIEKAHQTQEAANAKAAQQYTDKYKPEHNAKMENAQKLVGQLQGSENAELNKWAADVQAAIQKAQAAWEAYSQSKTDQNAQAYQSSLNALKTTMNDAAIAQKHLNDAMKDEQAFQKAKEGADKALVSIKQMREEWTRMSDSDRDRLSGIETNLQMGISAHDVGMISQARSELAAFRTEMKGAGKDSMSFSSKLGAGLKKLLPMFSTAQIVMSLRRRVQEMITNVKQIDASMMELKKVSDETDASYEHFLKNAGQRSQELAVSMTDYIDAATNFNRLGESFADSQMLGEEAIKLKNVGAQINSIDDATNTLISSMKAFKIETTDVTKIADAMTYIGKQHCRAA